MDSTGKGLLNRDTAGSISCTRITQKNKNGKLFSKRFFRRMTRVLPKTLPQQELRPFEGPYSGEEIVRIWR